MLLDFLWTPFAVIAALRSQNVNRKIFPKLKAIAKHNDRSDRAQIAEQLFAWCLKNKKLFKNRALFNNTFELPWQRFVMHSVFSVIFEKEMNACCNGIVTRDIGLVEKSLSQGKGLIIYGSHIGMVAVCRALTDLGHPPSMVTYLKDATPAWTLDDLKNNRELQPLDLIPTNRRVLFKAQRRLKAGGIVCLTADSDVTPTCFGLSKRLFVEDEKFTMSEVFDVPLLYALEDCTDNLDIIVKFIEPGVDRTSGKLAMAKDFVAKLEAAQDHPVCRTVHQGKAPYKNWRAPKNLFLIRDTKQWRLMLPWNNR
ncbi:MAG: hypothetical protein AAFR98_08185 [Pseudomonadota bacterium]